MENLKCIKVVKCLTGSITIPLEKDSLYSVVGVRQDFYLVILNNGKFKELDKSLFRNLTEWELDNPRLRGNKIRNKYGE